MGAMVALSARSTAPIALIVEDDETVREVVGMVLESEGYVTHEASNGVEGLEQYYVTLPDLILLDVKMPGMDGWETLEKVRQVSDCPVIMLTAFGATDDIIRGLELGADDYLIKPFGIRELIARVNTVLRRSSLIR